MSGPAGEKLQKILARAGLGSRREIETWLAAGRVSVNGSVAGLGDRAQATDLVRVDGRRVALVEDRPTRVLRYHKPVGTVCTRRDADGRATVFDALPRAGLGRWIAIGRLDINTCGLLLFTDDGELAHRLMHPSSEVEREYAVRVLGEPSAEQLESLRQGVALDDGPARFEAVREAGGEGRNRWYHVTVREGRNREVRRLWESQGLQVSRLIRVRFGPVTLRRGLRAGAFENLAPAEVDALRELVGLPAQGARGRAAPGRRQGPRSPARGRIRRPRR